jgi:8-oxo-dGTP pyrophosphatase MutT (NUDIX family)
MLLQDLLEKKETKRTAWVIAYTPDKIILGKRSPNVNNPNQWNFFGGNIDAGENAAEAAAREMEEEIGVRVSASQLKQVAVIDSATYFIMKIVSGFTPKKTEETSGVKGFKITNLPDNMHAKTAAFFNDLDNLFQ